MLQRSAWFNLRTLQNLFIAMFIEIYEVCRFIPGGRINMLHDDDSFIAARARGFMISKHRISRWKCQ